MKKAATKVARYAGAELAPLSRDAIVEAAIVIADRDGLDAVSLRSVGSALDAGPMRLYRHVESKEALLQLMIDAVYGELERPAVGDWREALRTIARTFRAASRKHPWFVAVLGGRPSLGASAFAFMEACLAALDFADLGYALEALRLVKSYVIGAIQSEASDIASGLSREQWQDASWPRVQELLSTGHYPLMARVAREVTHPADELERGIERILAGIEAGMRKRQ